MTTSRKHTIKHRPVHANGFARVWNNKTRRIGDGFFASPAWVVFFVDVEA